MSFRNEYNPEFGVVFDWLDDLIKEAAGGGGEPSTIVEEEVKRQQRTAYNPATGNMEYQESFDGGKTWNFTGTVSSRPPTSTTNNYIQPPPTGTDYVTEQELINEGFVKVGPALYERYDGTRIQQYQGNKQADGSIAYQLKFIGAPPKGYKGPVAQKPPTIAEDGTVVAAPQQFPAETHGTSEPVFDRSGELQYQYNDPETNTSYSRGYQYEDVKKQRAADIKEQNAREALLEGEDPFAFANGGNFVASGPQLIVDANTGQTNGVFGEAGQEMATFTPLDPFEQSKLQNTGPPDSPNLRPWPWQRNALTGEWEIAPEVLAREQAGMYTKIPMNKPVFADGGTMTTVPETGLLGYDQIDPSAFNPPAASIPAIPLPTDGGAVPVPLPQVRPVDPFGGHVEDGFRKFGNFLGNYLRPTADPITDPYAALPDDIRQRREQMLNVIRQREINAYKYGIAGLPQPYSTPDELIALAQVNAINQAAPGYSGRGSPIGLVNNQIRNSADRNLRGQLGMESPGASPGNAPSIGGRPLPVDPFALFSKLTGVAA